MTPRSVDARHRSPQRARILNPVRRQILSDLFTRTFIAFLPPPQAARAFLDHEQRWDTALGEVSRPATPSQPAEPRSGPTGGPDDDRPGP